MTIVVNTHNEREEQELLDFLERMKYEYAKEDSILSDEQLAEISERDMEFEAGKAETYSLDQIKSHFNINK
jgi:hypothetical protein